MSGSGRLVDPRDSKPVIRDYRPEDEPSWVRCWGVVAVTSHAWGGPPYQSKPRYGRHSVQLVASLPGALTSGGGGDPADLIVGFIDVEIEDKPGELGLLQDSPCGFVWELGLVPEWRGVGLGRALLTAAADRLRAVGVRRMELWSMDPRAQTYYERMGMREINRHWRFWSEWPLQGSGVPTPAGTRSLRVQYVHATCSEEDWPKVLASLPVLVEPPYEPHLCRGFDWRF